MHVKLKVTNRIWFSVVCTLIDNDMRHHSGQNVVVEFNFKESVYFSFFLFFFSEWPRASQIDASSVVRTLIDNGKLASQIARLIAIVVNILPCCCLYNNLTTPELAPPHLVGGTRSRMCSQIKCEPACRLALCYVGCYLMYLLSTLL